MVELLCPGGASGSGGPQGKRRRVGPAATGPGGSSLSGALSTDGAAHSAGYDAWCTAYVYSHYLHDRGCGDGGASTAGETGAGAKVNELYLSGKSFTLKLHQSAFS